MKTTVVSIIVAVIIIGGAFILTKGNNSNVDNGVPANNVSVVDGKQIIEIKAKGGYSPKTSTAKANMPTILRFNTDGTFDCSSSVRIPSLGISKNLSASGATDIDLGNPKLGTLEGTCGMGMYPFEIEFKL